MTLRVSLYNPIALLALAAIILGFGSVVLVVSSNAPETKTEIPYVGLTLAYTYKKTTEFGEIKVEDRGSTLTRYVERVGEALFVVEGRDELNVFTHIVDARSRRYVQGEEAGNYVGHFVPLQLDVGDTVRVNPNKALKVLEHRRIRLHANDSFLIDAIVTGASFREPLADESAFIEEDVRFFHSRTGILLSQTSRGRTENRSSVLEERHNYEILIFDAGVDTDRDGLTDYNEILSTGTSPTSSDTDHDGWFDRIDPDPLNRLNPNLAAMLSLGTLGVFLFLKYRKRAASFQLGKSGPPRR